MRAAGDALQWSFHTGELRYQWAAGGWEAFDPFPGYGHDVGLVRLMVDAVDRRWRLPVPLTVHVAEHEALQRTNGWADRAYYGDDEDAPWPWHAHVLLSGKRIPPHPAVTRHAVAHELGHHVMWWLAHRRGLDVDELLDAYADLRGLPAEEPSGGGTWHRAIGEIFACDFRVVVCDVERGYWPHPGIPHPARTPQLVEWWQRHQP